MKANMKIFDRMKKYILIALSLCCIALTSCVDEIPGEFKDVDPDNICLRISTQTVFLFDETNCQYSFNNQKHIFRASNDSMSDYFIVTFSQTPTTEGQNVKADIIYTTETEIKNVRNADLTVENVDRNEVLLWDGKKKIGINIRIEL